MLGSTLNNPNLAAAGAYNQYLLGGKYLNGNPNLQGIIDNTNSDVTDRVQAAIGTRGGAGGSAQAQLLARELAKNETSLRYQDYSTERGYQNGAVGQATALSGANGANIQTLLQYLTGRQTLPQQGASTYAQGIGGLLGQYSSQGQTPSTGSSIANGLGTALQVASLFSDRRLKTDIQRIGEDADGLGRYRYRYRWEDEMREGVMADEVARLRPWALGPVIAGFATVDYSAL